MSLLHLWLLFNVSCSSDSFLRRNRISFVSGAVICDISRWVSGVIGQRGWIKLIFRNPSTGRTAANRLQQRAGVKFLCWITSASWGRSQPHQCLLLTDRCAEKQLNNTATSSVLDQHSLTRFPRSHLGTSCVLWWCVHHTPVRAPRHEWGGGVSRNFNTQDALVPRPSLTRPVSLF